MSAVAPVADLVIIGAGGAGRDVLDVVDAVNRQAPAWRLLGFVDDDPADEDLLRRRQTSVLGGVPMLAELDADYLIAIASPTARRRIDGFATGLGRRPALAVHPEASVGSDLELGPGLVMAAGARMTSNVRTGRHVQLNLNATVAHDCRLGDYVSVNPGANVNGNVTLADDVMIGAGAVIIQGVTVGHGTVVGAGAVVIADLPAGVTAVGVPARVLPPAAS